MILVDGIGIVVGAFLGRSMPQRAVKLLAAAVFIFFGIAGLYGTASTWP